MFPTAALAYLAKRHFTHYKCERCEVTWSLKEPQKCWVCGRFGRKR